MEKKEGKGRRVNINFRQTARAFASARQAQIFQHIKSNIPFNMLKFSKSQFASKIQKIHSNMQKKLPTWFNSDRKKSSE